MTRTTKILLLVWAIVVIGAFAGGIAIVVKYTPKEETMGLTQKIFYLHLPVAINTFMACLVAFVASLGYLWTRKSRWDDLAASAVKVAVVLCSIVLLTGMIWGRGAWGLWWTWSPRLTFSLMLWLLYVVYLIIRSSIDSRQRRAVVGAVYAVIAFLDVPLVYLSARLMPEIHPASITLETPMKLTLAYWFVPVTLMAGGLIVLRYLLARQQTLAAEAVERSAGANVRSTANIQPGSPEWEALLTRRGVGSAAEVNK